MAPSESNEIAEREHITWKFEFASARTRVRTRTRAEAIIRGSIVERVCRENDHGQAIYRRRSRTEIAISLA